jgi:hypothetical protein
MTLYQRLLITGHLYYMRAGNTQDVVQFKCTKVSVGRSATLLQFCRCGA